MYSETLLSITISKRYTESALVVPIYAEYVPSFLNSYHFELSLSSTHLPARFAAVSSSGVSLLLVSPPLTAGYKHHRQHHKNK